MTKPLKRNENCNVKGEKIFELCLSVVANQHWIIHLTDSKKLTKIYWKPPSSLVNCKIISRQCRCMWVCIWLFWNVFGRHSFSIFPSTIASTISLVFLSETNLAVATGPLFLRAPCSNCFTSSLDVSYWWEVTCVAGCTRSLHSTVQRNHHQKLLSSQMDISLLAQKFLLPKEHYLSLIFTLRG